MPAVTAPTTDTDPGPGVLDALALLPAYADELVLGAVRDTHRAVAGRSFGLVNRATAGAARPTQLLHDRIATAVYVSTGGALRAAGRGLAALGERGVGPRLDESPSGRVLHSAVNGLIGARLRDESPHLALGTTVRVAGRSIPVTPEALAETFPDASARVAVLVHGLGEHEGHWEADRYRVGGTYATTLVDAGWTTVALRVNTGLPVAENGVALTALLQDLVDAWPTPVEQVALLGHSMGGLIARAACAVATDHAAPWVDQVSDVITLGTPHFGADLARAVRSGAGLLALAPEVAAFGRILEERSPGIRDLERGLPDVPPLPHARYRLVSASLGSERSVVGRMLGDLLVRRGSATADDRRFLRLFPDADLLHVHRADHFSLLNHPEVHDALRRWLG